MAIRPLPARRQAMVTWELFEVRFRPDLSTSLISTTVRMMMQQVDGTHGRVHRVGCAATAK